MKDLSKYCLVHAWEVIRNAVGSKVGWKCAYCYKKIMRVLEEK